MPKTTELTHYGKFLNASGILFNESQRSIEQYKKMRKHPIIRLGLGFIKLGLADVPFSVECTTEDEEVSVIVEAMYKRIWKRLIRNSLECLDFGFKAMENLYEVGTLKFWNTDGDLKSYKGQLIKLPKSLDCETVQITIDDLGNFSGFLQDGDIKVLSNDGKALIIVNEFESGNYYGISEQEYVYAPWYDANLNRQFGMRWLERKGTGILKGKYPTGTRMVADVEKDNQDIMITLLDQMIEGTTVALPSESDEHGNPMWDIVFVDSEDRTDSFIEKAKFLNDEMLRGLLIPERALTQDNIGARASVESFQDMFIQRKQDVLDNVVDWINEYSVKPFVKYNFGDMEVQLKAGKIDDNSIIVANQIIQKLIEGGKEKVKQQWLMDKTGIPLEDYEEEPVVEETEDAEDPKNPKGQSEDSLTKEDKQPEEDGEVKSMAERRMNRIEERYNFATLDSYLTSRSEQFQNDMSNEVKRQLVRINNYVTKNFDPSKFRQIIDGVTISSSFIDAIFQSYMEDVYNYYFALLQKGIEGTYFSTNFAAVNKTVAFRVDITGEKFLNDMLSDIKYSLGNSFTSGYGLSEIISRMGQSVSDFLSSKLPVLAETEMGFAISASNEAYFALNKKLVDSGQLPAEKKIQRFRSSAVLDSKTTALCRELDGLVVPEGSPIMEKYSCPRHYHCRSIWMPITEEMINDPRYEGTDLTLNQKGKPITTDNVTSMLGGISVGSGKTALDQNLFG